ncbi:MAG: DUF2127 domain-containing protein [Candidatus Dormibacteraeota bacterium]|nr:DUF2127 domain-containing protein [Candidatus Dormibacteraeota bacterium]
MSGLLSWVRWEFSRRIEVNGVIVYIICERLLKATVLIGGGIVLLVVAAHTDLRALAENAREQLSLGGGTSLWRRLFDQVLAKFGTHADPIAVGAILYGLLEVIEAVGLIRRRRWAEYLVLLATVAFLPVEIDEVLRKPSALKALTLLINVAIAVYLVWRKQLFVSRKHSSAGEA